MFHFVCFPDILFMIVDFLMQNWFKLKKNGRFALKISGVTSIIGGFLAGGWREISSFR